MEIIYTISYQWIGVIGIFGTIVIGLLASFVTGECKVVLERLEFGRVESPDFRFLSTILSGYNHDVI